MEAYSLAAQNLGECRTFFGGSNASRRRGAGCCSPELPLMMPCSKSFGSMPRCTLGSSRASQATHPPKQMPGTPFLYHSITLTSRLTEPAFAGSVSHLPNHIASALSPLHICYLLFVIGHHDVVVSTSPTGPRKQLVLRRERESLRLWPADRSLCARLLPAEAHDIVFVSGE